MLEPEKTQDGEKWTPIYSITSILAQISSLLNY